MRLDSRLESGMIVFRFDSDCEGKGGMITQGGRFRQWLGPRSEGFEREESATTSVCLQSGVGAWLAEGISVFLAITYFRVIQRRSERER
jgi:hypothetical protein